MINLNLQSHRQHTRKIQSAEEKNSENKKMKLKGIKMIFFQYISRGLVQQW